MVQPARPRSWSLNKQDSYTLNQQIEKAESKPAPVYPVHPAHLPSHTTAHPIHPAHHDYQPDQAQAQAVAAASIFYSHTTGCTLTYF